MASRARAAKSGDRSSFKAITHPDKVFWPGEGYTKLDLARFYESVFPKLRPYVQGHLLTLERCPDGMGGECFYQKEMPKGMPPGTPTKAIRHKTGITHYVVGGSLETQLALVNFGCIAVHEMATTADSPRQPDWICFDLDPQSGEFRDAAQAALRVKEALDDLHLTSFAKTSGSRGMHVFVPVRRGPDADDVLAFARKFCERLAAAHPRELTVEHSIEARGERVYLDKANNDVLHDEVTTIDHALTRPWTVDRVYLRTSPPRWIEKNCAESNPHLRIGTEDYFLSAYNKLMPVAKGQEPPDLSYFKSPQQ